MQIRYNNRVMNNLLAKLTPRPHTASARRVSRACALALALLMCLTAASCAQKPEVKTAYSPAQIAQAIIEGQGRTGAMEPLTPGDGMFEDYLAVNYRLDAALLEDGAVYYADGGDASEVAVLLVKDAANTQKVTDALSAYKYRRVSALTGYMPEQEKMASQGIITSKGNYAALLIIEDPAAAEFAFASCFNGNPPKLPDNASSRSPTPDEAGQSTPEGGAPATDIELSSDPNHTASHSPDPTPAPGVTEPEQGQESGRPDSQDETPSNPGEGDALGSPSESPVQESSPTPSQDTSPTQSKPPQPPTTPSPSASELPSSTPSSTPSQQPPTQSPPTGAQTETPDATPAADDRYNRAAVLAAWRSGDSSSLTEKNRKILEAASDVIGSRINQGMSDYDKELTIHDWIVLWTSYDEEASSTSPNATPDPDNDNPYGVFFSRKSICAGYSSTFQLFMDMLGIECITVAGHARDLFTEHAWNMVKLGGEWYCVDVTWDDPVGDLPPTYISHNFFNVTSEFMRMTEHIWDEAAVPEATATKYAYGYSR